MATVPALVKDWAGTGLYSGSQGNVSENQTSFIPSTDQVKESGNNTSADNLDSGTSTGNKTSFNGFGVGVGIGTGGKSNGGVGDLDLDRAQAAALLRTALSAA